MMKRSVLAVEWEVYGGGHKHSIVVGAGGRMSVDVDPIAIAVAKEQSIVIRVFVATYWLWLA